MSQGLSAIVTARSLIKQLQMLPPDTEIFVFDPQDGSRYEINSFYALDYWDEEKGFADINLLAITVEDE